MRDGGTAHSTPHFLEQRGEVERNHLPAGLKLMISRVNDGSFPGGKGMENVTQETPWRNLSHLSSAQPVQEKLLERGRISQTGQQGEGLEVEGADFIHEFINIWREGGRRDQGERPFSVAPSDKHKLKYSKLHSNQTKKNVFIGEKWSGHWNRLQISEPPPLEILKTQQDTALNNLL